MGLGPLMYLVWCKSEGRLNHFGSIETWEMLIALFFETFFLYDKLSKYNINKDDLPVYYIAQIEMHKKGHKKDIK